MFLALTFVATVVVRIPTPVGGYIHAGEGVVLLAACVCGGPGAALAVALGAALSDLAAGYALWVPGTFVIKFFTVFLTGRLVKKISVLPSLILGEVFMMAGYFLYDTQVLLLSVGGLEVTFSAVISDGYTAANSDEFSTALSGALTSAAADLPFNLLQGIIGIILCLFLLPVFRNYFEGVFRKP